ncbi:MAG: hypothetical protein Q7K42_01830, partial [Candidatus Diapherotrites archaeon]|nr:hypothetical protein [Candidatus Diapherotrites archaeon]
KILQEFDKEFLKELYSESEGKGIVFSQQFETKGFETFKKDESESFEKLKQALSEFAKSKNSLSYSSQKIALKKIKSSLEKILQDLKHFNSKNIFELKDKCIAKIEALDKGLAGYKSENIIEAINIAEIKTAIQEFKTKTGISEQLLACKKPITLFKKFQELKESNTVASFKEKSAEECFAWVEKALGNFPELEYYSERLSQIKNLQNEDTEIQCSYLQEEIIANLKRGQNLKEVITNFQGIKSLHENMKSLAFNTKYFDKILEIRKFFPGEEIDIANNLDSIGEIIIKTNSLKTDLEKEFAIAVAQNLEANFEKIILYHTGVIANSEQKINQRIILNNPFPTEINQKFQIKIPFTDSKSIEITSKSSNIKKIELKNGFIYLEIESLPQGQTWFEFTTIQKALETSEKTKVVSVSSEIAETQKEIKITTSSEIPKAKIQTEIPVNSKNITIIADGKKINEYKLENG